MLELDIATVCNNLPLPSLGDSVVDFQLLRHSSLQDHQVSRSGLSFLSTRYVMNKALMGGFKDLKNINVTYASSSLPFASTLRFEASFSASRTI